MNLTHKLLKSQHGANVLISILAVSFIAGCASAETTVSHPYMGAKLAKPSRVLVYDFSSDLNQVPVNSPLKKRVAERGYSENAQNSALSRQLGAQIATDLVTSIREMGLPGVRATGSTSPRPGDIVFKGYFMTLEEGSAAERMALGFGSGAAELKVIVEGYQMTDQGLRFLGSGEGLAGSGKTPGTALSLGVAIATANPIGLAVSGAAKAAGEVSGKETIEGASERITKKIAERLREAFVRQGWL